jgi:hypothetical protein
MAQLPRWQNKILSIFLASTGLLLASFLLGTGRLFVDTPRQNQIRSVLAFAGIVVLTAGLALLVVAKTQFNLEIDVALLLLAGGVLIPIALNFQMWRTDPLRRDPTPLQDNALTEEEYGDYGLSLPGRTQNSATATSSRLGLPRPIRQGSVPFVGPNQRA